MNNITHEQIIAFIKELSQLGYAVVVFTPEELQGVDPQDVETKMVMAGNDEIDYLLEQ